jgi:hypothetical protein
MKLIFVGSLLLGSTRILAQDADDLLLIGTWKGTSICQIKPSACRDEAAAYHITKRDNSNTYHIVMNKVINGKEEDMTEYDYSFDGAKKTLTAVDEKHKIVWTFHVKADKMEGTLASISDPNKIYRIIKLSKTNK